MNPKAPGVYIEEIDSGSRTIQSRDAGIAAFVGLAPDANALVNEAVGVTSPRDFEKRFVQKSREPTDLAVAVNAFFRNGGSYCYVINTGRKGPLDRACERRLEELDDVTIVAAPGATNAADYDLLLSHCERRSPSDRMAILDPPADVEDVDALIEVASEGPTAEAAKKAGDAPAPRKGLRPRESPRGLGAFYFPWLWTQNPYGDKPIRAAPSGFVAGIWARCAPHKPPANEIIAGALGVTYTVIAAEQGKLNSAGVNCIRKFSQSGTTVWGARTLADPASDQCYINVRRVFCSIQTAIALDTRGYVFRPNDHNLWKMVSMNVGNYLRGQWRAGALQGRNPEQAFFVKCDEDTNPPESIREGKLVVEIGIAPVRPAEFVIFRIGQSDAGMSVEG